MKKKTKITLIGTTILGSFITLNLIEGGVMELVKEVCCFAVACIIMAPCIWWIEKSEK